MNPMSLYLNLALSRTVITINSCHPKRIANCFFHKPKAENKHEQAATDITVGNTYLKIIYNFTGQNISFGLMPAH
jgi:hypothetical protein